MLYWSVANPNPYTRLKRHGSADAVPLTAPADLYSNSTVALDVSTGKLVWYYQELPGDDWDADHNHERMLIRPSRRPGRIIFCARLGRSLPERTLVKRTFPARICGVNDELRNEKLGHRFESGRCRIASKLSAGPNLSRSKPTRDSAAPTTWRRSFSIERA